MCWSIGEVHCECFIVLKSPVINNRYSDSLYSGTRSEGNGATGGVVVTSSYLWRIECELLLISSTITLHVSIATLYYWHLKHNQTTLAVECSSTLL